MAHSRTACIRTQKPLLLLLLAGVLLASGCASVKDDRRETALKAATYRYHTAIRWGYFEDALALQHPEQRDESVLEHYAGIRVTAYEIVQPLSEVDPDTRLQVARIDYVREDTQMVRQLIDRQRWGWDPQTRIWWLLSELPPLR